MKWIYRTEEFICFTLIIGATLVLFINVILRNLGMGTSWSDEFIRYSFVWITFLGGAICVRIGAHVSVDLIDNFLKEKGKKIIFVLSSVIALVFLAAMFVVGVEQVIFTLNSGQTTPGLKIPIYFVYLAFPIGFFMMAFHYIILLINLARNKTEIVKSDHSAV
ncbi:TRAP transporter small permease [Fredinandcohnia onubensis]|uniref:TRAP transporter small permease n=1 Tax=Fredinandcohnia onubensis TaxID=1571209 RepID=UPI000C0BE2DF|nr:TRAP transporter small permease [Fredinandcohnia onubensis]